LAEGDEDAEEQAKFDLEALSEPPEFDEEVWHDEFNEANPPIEIPEEIEEDIDNDFNLEIVREAEDLE
jgi:hypothetical protein